MSSRREVTQEDLVYMKETHNAQNITRILKMSCYAKHHKTAVTNKILLCEPACEKLNMEE